MGLYNLLYDRKSEPGAPLILAAGEIGFVKTLPDFLQAVLGDADAGVFYGDENLFVAAVCLDVDGGIVVAELDRVVDQVVEHLLYFPKVRVDHLNIIREGQVKDNVFVVAGPLKGRGRVLNHPVDVKIGAGQVAPVVQGVEGEHTLGQLVQALGLGDHTGEVFTVHLRRNGAVQNGLQIPFDGGQGGAEVVGDVGDEVLLVFLHLVQLVGHVIQGVGQITHLIVGVHGDAVVQVPGRVLVGAHRDLAQRQINGFGEHQQNDGGQHEDQKRGDVENVQNPVLRVLHLAHGQVDQHITVGVVIPGNGGGNAEHVLGEQAVVAPDGVGTVADGRGIEIVDHGVHPRAAGAVHDNGTLAVHHHDLGAQKLGHGPQLGGGVGEVLGLPLIHGAVGGRDQAGLVVQRVGPALDQVIPRHAGGKGGDENKAQKAEHQVAENEF